MINRFAILKTKMAASATAGIRKARMHKMHYLFILPFATVFLCFTVLPVVISIYLSFTYFNGLQIPIFTGLSNYYRLFFNDDIFVIAVKNTFIFAVITGPVSYLLCLMLAWLINELPRALRTIMTLFFYAPSISGGMYMIWSVMFSGDTYGYINGFLLKLGTISQPIQFLKDPAYMNSIIIIVVLWMSLGVSFLAFIAGLQGVDRQYYEAAALDGVKNRWQELWFVTLPIMKPQLMFGAVMSITASFGIGDVITNMVGYPSVNYTSHTIMHHLMDYGGMRFEMGYSSSIATVLFLVMVVSNVVVQKILSKVGE